MASCVVVFASTRAEAMPSAGGATEQQAIEQMVVSPCCWRKTVAEEGTAEANEVRREIARLLAKGHSRDQVLDALVEKWSERILVAPRTKGFNLVLYALPAVAIAGGLLLLVFVLKKWGGAAPEAGAAAAGGEPEPVDPGLIRRVEDELARMD